MASRISLPVTGRLSERERAAVAALEHHLALRIESEHEPLDIDADGYSVTFLTVKRMQRCLRATGKWRGEHFARECLNEILPRLGLIEDTGEVKKPEITDEQKKLRRKHFGDGATSGGRDAQPSILHSYWWRMYRLPTLPRLIVSHFGVWLSDADGQTLRSGRKRGAFLSALHRSQELQFAPRRRSGFSPGSVQWAFAHSGPP
jgi:hypothetical protein